MMKKSKEVQLSFSPHILQKSQNKNGGSFQKKKTSWADILETRIINISKKEHQS